MRLTPQRGQFRCEVVERCSGQANHLASLADRHHCGQAHCIDDDNRPVVTAPGCGTPGQAGVRGLRDDDMVRRDAGLEGVPQFQQRARPDHCHCCAASFAIAGQITRRCRPAGQDIAPAKQQAKVGNQPGTAMWRDAGRGHLMPHPRQARDDAGCQAFRCRVPQHRQH